MFICDKTPGSVQTPRRTRGVLLEYVLFVPSVAGFLVENCKRPVGTERNARNTSF